MRARVQLIAAVCAVTALASACGGSGATPTASPTPTASATPTASPTASPTSAVSGFYLRRWFIAPVGPDMSFYNGPLVISDGQLLTTKYDEAVQPARLYPQPVRQTVSEAGLTMIIAEAQNAGLLGTTTEFSCPHDPGDQAMAGTGITHLLMIVGGVTHELSAGCAYEQPTPAPGTPAPGTWAAWRHFDDLLSDPTSWLAAYLGPVVEYDAESLAVLLEPFTVDPGSETPNPANVVTWPLGTFASFGVDIGGGGEGPVLRCAVVTGTDAATLLPIAEAATTGEGTDTVFSDGSGTFAGMIVRAFLPGEPDPCGSQAAG